MERLKVGDSVEVLDEGLAMLRRLCPGMPPNHHGTVKSIEGEIVYVEFPIGEGDEAHSQVAPYSMALVRRRASP